MAIHTTTKVVGFLAITIIKSSTGKQWTMLKCSENISRVAITHFLRKNLKTI